MGTLTIFEKEISKLMVETLNLTINHEEVDPNKPLFKEGLGLDSIDALELSLIISQEYGLEIKSDNEDIKQLFSSLRNLSKYIQENKKNG